MKEPRYDVYRLEVFEPVYVCTIQNAITGDSMPISVGGRVFVDVVIPNFDILREQVYEAMMHNIGDLWITHLGARRLVTTCAQFEAEYGRGRGN